MNKDVFINRVQTLNSDDEYEKLSAEMLSKAIPWFFKEKFGDNCIEKYSEFKLYMANKFQISPQDVCLGGSAWFGFSLSPDKDYKKFHDSSDIDIVIISEKIFSSFWNCYLKAFSAGKLSGDLYTSLAKNTFKRFVDYKADTNLLTGNSYYRNFQKKINGYAKDLQVNFDFPEKIGYRIYRSWDDYKLNVIVTLRDLNRRTH